MTGKVLELRNILEPDTMGTRITDKYVEWDMLRRPKRNDWEELRRYVYATDTRSTSNSSLPWKNSTTIPKLCQIRDNLYANYSMNMFPQAKWIIWQPFNGDSADKAESIQNYMSWVIDQTNFRNEMDKIILDYIDYGNCFATVEWVDDRVETPEKTQVGYVGPSIRRISPLDIVFNPTAENFAHTPKIIRSLISVGELKDFLTKMSNDEDRAEKEELYKYLRGIRNEAVNFQGDFVERDNQYSVDGFTSFRAYLMSEYVEVLTFYGDLYDHENDIFKKNRVITIVDRHKVVGDKPNPSFFGTAPIFHCAWRKRQDNLWGMGPLDNLVGMQYRMDHVENMKADIFDLTTYPVQMIKGFVEDYTWQPGEKIVVGEEGSVEMVVPDVNALSANFEIDKYEYRMESMAGAPREALGIRSPGEKTKYEVQSLENSSGRMYQHKTTQFEENMPEPLMNAMLELAKRNMTGPTSIMVMDDEYKMATFETLTIEDITGVGRIKPIAARHFAEQSVMIQNLTQMSSSNLWPFMMQHFSSMKMAEIFEDAFNLDQYELVMKNVQVFEQAELKKDAQAAEEVIAKHTMTATGIGEDYDTVPQPVEPPPPEQ